MAKGVHLTIGVVFKFMYDVLLYREVKNRDGTGGRALESTCLLVL